jgi:hypothetical protein
MSGSRKYSISLPEDLAEALRAHVGPGGFSAYVAEALEQRIAMDRLRKIVADFETGTLLLDSEGLSKLYRRIVPSWPWSKRRRKRRCAWPPAP